MTVVMLWKQILKTTMKKLFGMAAMALAAVLLPSCSKDNSSLMGEWQSAAPVSVKEAVADATSASQTLTINFQAGKAVQEGSLEFTSEYDMTAPADSTGAVKSYKVIAKVSGTWALESGEDDDYILTFDRNSLSVTGQDAPELGPTTDLFLSQLARYSKIEDVKVAKDGKTMSFELDHPDVTLQFVKK